MPYRASCLSVLVLVPIVALAQKEDFIWRFGPTGAGLDFNQCPPLVTMNGTMDGTTFEGCVAVADRNTGELLFYTNGYRVYDGSNSIMVNGDPIGVTSHMAQNVILPKPGTDDRYYIVTPDMQGGVIYQPTHPEAAGVNVAEVDMSQGSGLGAVISTFIPLKAPPNCEMLTAVRKDDGTFWLVGHEYGNDHFFVFDVTANGISALPTIYPVGPIIVTTQPGPPTTSNIDAVGTLSTSPDRTKLAFTTFYGGTTALVRFNHGTGEISDPVVLDIAGAGYGTCFSPDGTKLYVTRKDSAQSNSILNGALLQFDVTSWDSLVIQASLNTIHSIPVGGFGSLKRGPDDKIYVARVGSDGSTQGDGYLGVINEPNEDGTACDYVHNALFLNGQRGSWGLNCFYETSNRCNSTVGSPEHSTLPELKVTTIYNTMELQWPSDQVFNKVALVAIDGRVVHEQALLPSRYRIDISTDRLPPGPYIIQLVGNKQCFSKAVVIGM